MLAASGHPYLWHEHRTHTLEPLANRQRTSTVLGSWSVPLRIDGRPHVHEGPLVYRPPGLLWPRIAPACALALALAGAARRFAVAAAVSPC